MVTFLVTVLGIGLDFSGINPMKALYWAGIINGWLAPFLLVGVLWIASDSELMKQQPSPVIARVIVGLTALIMLAAAIGMFL